MRDALGFSTLEAMLAVSLAGAALAGALLTERGATAWMQSSLAQLHALPKVAQEMAALEAQSENDFFHIVSSFTKDNPQCAAVDGCDGMRRTVTEVSTCAKVVETQAETHRPGRPVNAVSSATLLTDFAEIAALGGDCSLVPTSGDWSNPLLANATDLGGGTPTGIDALDGVTYVAEDAPPYLRIVTRDGVVTFTNGFVGNGPFNDVDVTSDIATGRIYAFVAAIAPQLQIIDVTDPSVPVLIGSAPLAGVTLKGAQAGAWRVMVYGGTAYVAARYMLAANPELHLFDVSDPASPREYGSGYKMSTSVYDMVVHEQVVPSMNGARHRLAYMATTSPAGELKVFDVTLPTSPTPLASCDLPGSYQANALALLGTTLFVGRDNVPGGSEDLYAFDAADPASTAFCTPVAKTDIGTDGFSRHVQALRASGPFLFVATNNTTNAHGQVQIRSAEPKNLLALLGTFSVSGLAEHALDYDDATLSAASAASPQLVQLHTP